MSASRFPSTLQALLIVNAVTVIGLSVSSHFASLSTPGIRVMETLVAGGVAVACVVYIGKRVASGSASDPGSAAPAAPSEDIKALRRETAENLSVIQNDLRQLGGALIRKIDGAGQSDSDAAISGAMTDLAISLAEARETLAAIAAELAEVKSATFEMQAQIDQQADALRAFEHTVGASHEHPSAHDAGDGAAPGSLGKALVSGASGSAVARLIGNGYHAATEEAAVAAETAPVAATDVESDYDAPDAPIPAADFEAGDLVAEHAADPIVEEKATEEEVADAETDDWLSMGIDEDEEGLPAAAPAQADLLTLDEETKRKPRRPGKHDTALIAHVMIGIGNKPYLRGHGPGLSPEKGVPMEYVDVGRWQWVAPESGSPLTVTLWKNDEVPAEGDPVGVPSGMTLEIHPHFGA